MSLSDRVSEIRNGFHPTFWVANGMELFERIAYYGQATVLSIFLRDYLKFTEIEAGQLSSIFGGLIYLLPIFAGAMADKFGFKAAFSIAFSLLGLGYFLIGWVGQQSFMVMAIILVLTAIGGSFIKPAVLGTVAVTTKPETKSLGFAVYYWIVNIGGALGPLIAYFVRDAIGIKYVYMVSAISCFLMLVVNLAMYKEIKDESKEVMESIGTKMKNLVLVLRNFKFMIFLLIFSLYWIMFWQIFIIIPYFVTDFIDKDAPFEIIQSADAWGIIAFQLIVNRLTKNFSARKAIIIGFIVSSLCWLVIAFNPTIWMIIAGLVVFSIGEMTLAPRYYEYISDLAPKGQQGLFQGYAFLPVAIAWAVGGTFGGWLYVTFAKTAATPNMVWYALFGVGVLATVCMAIYNFVVEKSERAEA